MSDVVKLVVADGRTGGPSSVQKSEAEPDADGGREDRQGIAVAKVDKGGERRQSVHAFGHVDARAKCSRSSPDR